MQKIALITATLIGDLLIGTYVHGQEVETTNGDLNTIFVGLYNDVFYLGIERAYNSQSDQKITAAKDLARPCCVN
jgi:hypothetical protein